MRIPPFARQRFYVVLDIEVGEAQDGTDMATWIEAALGQDASRVDPTVYLRVEDLMYDHAQGMEWGEWKPANSSMINPWTGT